MLSQVVYSQPPSPSGGVLKSSWYPPDGLDGDAYAYDSFTLGSTQTIDQIQWRGGYTNFQSGAGESPVFDFTISIYASIPAGIQPDVVHPPLARYTVGGNAGETPAGIIGSIPMYSYSYTLSTPFQAQAGTKYWVQIEASQRLTPNYSWPPDWGLETGTGGDGSHFQAITGGTNGGGTLYYTASGDTAFTLLSSGPAAPLTPTVTVGGGPFTYDGASHAAVATVTDVNANPVNGTVRFYYSQSGVSSPPINAGTYNVQATFTSSDPAYGNATATGSLTINPARTAVALGSSRPGPVAYGTPVTFTATVTNTDTAAVPAGYVTFLKGGTYLGRGSLVNGVATFATSTLPVGTDVITAAFSTPNFVASTSNAVTWLVSPAHTSIRLMTTATGPVAFGRPAAFSVVVTNTTTAPVPVGYVVFMDGLTVMGKVNLGPTGRASYTIKSLSRGTHAKVTALFVGTSGFLRSASAPLSLRIV